MSLKGNRKALSIVEVVVSITILVVVVATYGSATQGKAKILRQMEMKSFYQRMAHIELERVLLFIHSSKRESKDFASTAKTDITSVLFQNFTKVFSHEGKSAGVDALESSATADPRIPLMQLEVHGADHGGSSIYTDLNDDSRYRFLSFPYPEELKYGYDHKANDGVVSNHPGSFHNITSTLKTQSYRAILPLVSEEFIYRDDSDNKLSLGYDLAAKRAGADVQLDAGIQLFVDPFTIGTWDNEMVRRYVYYRKIREGNLVFRNNVKGRGSIDKTAIVTTTNVDLLFIQNLRDWTTANGSSTAGNLTGVEGGTFAGTDTAPEVGGAGSHSILVMVVVRALDRSVVGAESIIQDGGTNGFLDRSEVKAVVVGIAAPSYGKNLLESVDLSYHRYAWSRIPGLKLDRQ
jgi:hypothetical protein